MSLYRTMLFTPANDLRKVGKALMLKADGVVLDLEDAVAISEKTRARLALKEALALPRSGDVFYPGQQRSNRLHPGRPAGFCNRRG
jgi:citrate lyase beta subunit